MARPCVLSSLLRPRMACSRCVLCSTSTANGRHSTNMLSTNMLTRRSTRRQNCQDPLPRRVPMYSNSYVKMDIFW